jgi:hypothetical protein
MAAGQGFKTFATGDVLTAADTNGYLMQGVWVFANAAARDAAVTSPQEGNMCYLKDTDATQSYSGSAWVAVGASGGGMTLLSTTAMSGNATITVSSISGSYNQLAIQVLDSYPSSPGSMSVRFNSDATAAAYVYNINYYPVDTGSGVTRNTTGYSTTSVGISEGTIQTSDNNNTVYMTLQNYSDSTVRKLFTFNNGFQNFGSNQSLSTGSGYWNNIAAITSVSIITSGGTWTQGSIKIWGIK